MIIFDRPLSHLEHYGVRGMKWGQKRRDLQRSAADAIKDPKTSAAVGAAAVGSVLYATGTLKPTAIVSGKAAVFGLSKTGGLLVKVGAFVGNKVVDGAITVVGVPYNMIKNG